MNHVQMIMREYPDIDAVAAELGITGDPDNDALHYEADWGINRASGRGLPGGWLVTLAFPHRMRNRATPAENDPPEGWLIAHAMGPDSEKTGRILVVAGPWNHWQDDRNLDAARRQAWFHDTLDGAPVHLHRLENWLRRPARMRQII